jgi:hypothetical protein
MSQTPAQRKSIENGIWLCGACAGLIDKNDGIDHPREHLRRWKADHETLVATCLEGSKRVVLRFLQSPTDLDLARSLLVFLQQRGALFMPYHSDVSFHVIDSIKEIRTFLTQLQAQLSPESPLDAIVESINHACRHFYEHNFAGGNHGRTRVRVGSVTENRGTQHRRP